MFQFRLVWTFALFIVCSFCGKDFQSLGRHSWRCKKKCSAPGDVSIQMLQDDSDQVCKQIVVKCSCGKECKGVRGLKMHQRRCCVIEKMDDDQRSEFEFLNYDVSGESTNEQEVDVDKLAAVQLKPGMKLPRSQDEWTSANEVFKAVFGTIKLHQTSIDSTIEFMNNTIYDYFTTRYGTVNSNNHNNPFCGKYNHLITKLLKLTLKQLKMNNASFQEIKYVSHLLRSKLSNKDIALSSASTVNQDRYISKNFWGFVKNVIEKGSAVLPSFSHDTCTRFFAKMFSAVLPCKKFTIPHWIPSFDQPSFSFDQAAPSYGNVTQTIRKIKSSSSPCPLDKISVICFKRCPYLRTFLTENIRIVWESGRVPSEWKKACTILVHKKGSSDDPANFRPITLESVPLKVFTSCLHDYIFSFLEKNNCIETEIQKGFTPKISGVLEHTSMMASIIDKARIKQRSVVITLIDLKNAFGEVHHNLITEVLIHHHVPSSIQTLLSSLYDNFETSVTTDNVITPAIPVGRGVLQGDCLSPLLFNMCFNTFIQVIRQEKYKQLGFSSHGATDRLFNPIHWFQFADDAAVVTTDERENQLLLNCFTKWCQWAKMIIRVDKCVTFGIKKFSSRSLQFQPKLFINTELLPVVNSGESFRYLGRYFNFEMDNENHKVHLKSSLLHMMNLIDLLRILPKNRLLLYQRYVLSKLSWHLTVADLSKTWVIENLDNVVVRFVRQWLDLPISATLSRSSFLRNNFGFNLLPSVKF